ncbi:hypothetical protein [Streptomyces sp. NPDC048489]|uniref:hypothetical protein n=1 Tax=Streptomyces sp. NPDC048489 TaxID=3154504 RepID=UPI003413E159
MTWDPTSIRRCRAKHFADPERYPAAQAIEGFPTDPVTAALINNPELHDPTGGDLAARYVLGIDYWYAMRRTALQPQKVCQLWTDNGSLSEVPRECTISMTTSTTFPPTHWPFA